MTIIEFIMVFFAGWFLGQIYFAWKMQREIQRVAKNLGITIEDITTELNEAIIAKNTSFVPELFTEYQQSSIMLYSKETGAFICQAPTLEDLACCAKEFKNIDRAKVEDKDKVLFFIDGKIVSTVNES